ncbi:MAG: hypothetical protein K9I68_01695 [Bacteroidales bacterium]|nr:hypothetical protein [Bacteroidales bacterium]MCF8338882.1 hypothetical protein [Bacteroidales bacterium]
MIKTFQSITGRLFCRDDSCLYNANQLFAGAKTDPAEKMTAAFLVCLSGSSNSHYAEAEKFLQTKKNDEFWRSLAEFYLQRVEDIEEEVAQVTENDDEFRQALTDLDTALQDRPAADSVQNKIWEVFFPQGVGVFDNKQQQVEELRQKRKVSVEKENPEPLTHPARQILFTSNVLLTIPHENTDVDSLDYTESLKEGIKKAKQEPQQYWYDHPIQIGVEPQANEIIYGLSQLDRSLEKERERENLGNEKVRCLLSVSVTHSGLLDVAKDYIQQELENHADLKNLEVWIFTEDETRRLLEEVFMPVDKVFFDSDKSEALSQVFGVDGEYGRHYSFLKAIAAVWNVLIDSEVRATFKIDLDQVFPQKELIEETGKSALEHFKTPLWGAKGKGNQGQSVELGMIAGALVNEKDIHKGLYTPDVNFPNEVPDRESRIFFSKLLMAVSTEGELMTQYNESSGLDGKNACLQRIHVTGGTNGILVDALRRYRPFTPTFIGRAEDQGYILSVLADSQKQPLGYLHADGLIMRHDKEAFAQEALKSAKLGKIAGDYIRLLYFSEYVRVLSNDMEHLKEILDPFTGSFISRIPITVAMLRQTMKAAEFFANGEAEQARKFLFQNVSRLNYAIDFIKGEDSKLKEQVETEREGWERFYDILDKVEAMPEQQKHTYQEKAGKVTKESKVV